MPDDNGAHMSPAAKELGWYLVEQWDLDPSVIEPGFMILRSGGTVSIASFAHDSLSQDTLPKRFREPMELHSAYCELMDAGFVTGMNHGRLTPRLRQAASRNFMEPAAPVLRMKLREETKRAAIRISRQMSLGRMPEVFHYLAMNEIGTDVESIFAQTLSGESLDDGGITSGPRPLLRQDIVAELAKAGLLHIEKLGPNPGTYSRITISPDLHDAVASNFAVITQSNQTWTGNVHINAQHVTVTGAAQDPKALADAIADHLLPVIQANLGIDTVLMQELYERLGEIKVASTDSEAATATERFYTYFSRIVDGGTFLAWLVKLVGG